jgi:hypothetical protein
LCSNLRTFFTSSGDSAATVAAGAAGADGSADATGSIAVLAGGGVADDVAEDVAASGCVDGSRDMIDSSSKVGAGPALTGCAAKGVEA